MRLNNKRTIFVYFIGALMNFFFLHHFYTQNTVLIVIFLSSIALNQFILVWMGLNISRNSIGMGGVSFAIISKMLILIGGFYVAMGYSDKSTIFLISSYIFQLIILILSIKRIT